MLGGATSRLGLLKRSSSFRWLFLARLGSAFGTYLALVALQIDVFDRTHSAAWISALLVADFLPGIFIGLVLSPILDRWSRHKIMVLSDLTNFAVFCALPFTSNASQVVALALVSGFANGLFRPIVYASLPNLVDEADLENANSLLQTIENLATLAGPPLGGLLAAAASPDAAYWLNAATFLLSVVFVLRIRPQELQTEQAISTGHWRDVAAGFSKVRNSAPLLTVFVTWNLAMIAIASVNVAEIVLAKKVLNSSDFGFGVLIAGDA